ncbi:hypothetical protein [Actinopolyspora halophila]|nr:hypothetical protein [Actinopolyspora halophila]
MSTLNEWLWVAAGYGITCGAVAAYVVVLGRRWTAVRRKGEQR